MINVQKLIELRKSLGWNQGEMADYLDVSRSYYNQVEGGREPISEKVAARIEVLEREQSAFQESTSAERRGPSIYAHLETPTLLKSLADLTGRFSKVTSLEQKHILGSMQEVLDELQQRALLKNAVEEVKHPGVIYGRSRRPSSNKTVSDRVMKEVERPAPKTGSK